MLVPGYQAGVLLCSLGEMHRGPSHFVERKKARQAARKCAGNRETVSQYGCATHHVPKPYRPLKVQLFRGRLVRSGPVCVQGLLPLEARTWTRPNQSHQRGSLTGPSLSPRFSPWPIVYCGCYHMWSETPLRMAHNIMSAGWSLAPNGLGRCPMSQS